MNYMPHATSYCSIPYPNSVTDNEPLRPIHTQHAVPLPCRAAKGLECVFPIRFTVRPCPIHTCYAAPMPSPTMPLFSRPRHSTSVESGLLARVRLLPATTRSYTKFLSVAYQSQMQVASVKPNTVCHGRGKGWQQHTTKKDDLLHRGLAVRIFPATIRTFTKDTALSEKGRAGPRHGMCELTHGMAGEQHGHGMLCVCESAFTVPKGNKVLWLVRRAETTPVINRDGNIP